MLSQIFSSLFKVSFDQTESTVVSEESIYTWSGGNIREENVLNPTFLTTVQWLGDVGRLVTWLNV